ncbi:hypothetical protein HD806DRAFT_494281 [Xylariaceae sp. AK1471]|nr:hypothetical protein HD806DRAFT_494281 [Xylariaceae sp. AK1471]
MKAQNSRFQDMQLLQLRGPTLPADCYNICNNAALEAQIVGEISALCSPGSVYLAYYESCKSCVEGHTAGPSSGTEWLGYCDSLNSTQGVSSTTTSQSSQTSQLPSGSTAVGVIMTATIQYPATIDGVETVLPLTKIWTSFPPLPDTTVITISTSVNEHLTAWIITKTFTHLPSDLFTMEDSNTVGTQSPTSTPSDMGTQRSQAWIAGPVAGGVAGVAILLLVVWLLFRMRKNRASKRRGHELHGETAIKVEMGVEDQPQEFDASEQARPPYELPARNP